MENLSVSSRNGVSFELEMQKSWKNKKIGKFAFYIWTKSRNFISEIL